ncbi:M20 aminoacylase family protein [Chitinasiproducens palmae]|uniref:Hippurate hydrolase n=1 Tax=Chitinasiproducens palmae TaxID=1770053 RepID=A0A1H2PN70_9BURK|nr:M20 aminoacylase family protein [Chitinasiproducens palmae]SDV47608.1 hippurate hydrolase [Chitinasiproducens palmae]
MKPLAEIEARADALRAWRQDIHAHPELGFEVHRTAAFVADKLEAWGFDVTRGVGRTGVVGTLQAGRSTRAIGLRADMDALPIHEANTFAHRSTVPGVMHACGHDGHTAMLLGAAERLAARRDFDGIVRCFFQPAEEGEAGARAMIEDGLFERFPVDAVFGVHNWPGIPAGHFGLRAGPLMASASEFRITVTGVGCHAAMPHLGHDPLFAAMQIANGLQGIVTRNNKPIDTVVLSVTQFHAGDADNVVPNHAWLGGTVRTFAEAPIDLIERRMKAIATTVAEAFDCRAEVDFKRGYPPTINDPVQAAFAADILRELVGDECVDADVEPTMGAEDFSFMLRERPGCYVFIGNGDGAHRGAGHGGGPCMLHNASYDFNDALLPIGASYFVRLAQRFLAGDAQGRQA